MCQQNQPTEGNDDAPVPTSNKDEPFPWHLGLHDAHCHPTDTMSSVASIPKMRTRTLTIMATRSQDQKLVSSVAEEHGVADDLAQQGQPCSVIPAFGWHPWFSHQLYDDEASEKTFNAALDAFEAKKAHYQSVLQPPPQDASFIDSLPSPTPLSAFTSQTSSLLGRHPHAMIGEVGLDKAFRLPQPWHPEEASQRDEGLTAGGREGRLLSPHRVRMEHQRVVLDRQLRLAGRMGRAVSVHGVQAHGVLYESLRETWRGHEREVLSKRQRKQIAPGADVDAEHSDADLPSSQLPSSPAPEPKPYPPRICLHSFSGAPEVLRQYLDPAIPCAIFFSFSAAVNLSTAAGRTRLTEVLAAVPRDRVLVESDLHRAGEQMDAAMEEIVRVVCEGVGWGLEEGVRELGRNYRRFALGG